MNEEDIFQVAAEMPAAERAAYLATACEGQPALRQRIERLLASHDHDAFMQRPADRADSAELEAELARLKPEEGEDRIGNFKLLQKIGEGGFGTVWMAEQLEPVRRRVALKIIKPGMDTKEVLVRFEQERQALALMDHPNIAKVLDAGVTPLGRPFFVMELVRGIRITDFCDQNDLSTRERLDLFIAVCHAIQHAHQKGIIHRDIKPSNILVTLHDGVPVPKVIDFGVAKAIQSQRLTDLTFFTRFEQMIGTPLYMSPEQAEMSGLDIDTRSDIYSLGVLLYELLTGTTPFDAKKLMALGIDAMRKTIRETEPVRPSTRLSQTLVASGMVGRVTPCAPPVGVLTLEDGARGATRPTSKSEIDGDSSRRLLQTKELIQLLRGDLDWIVMKCLEKDRSRRYDTANGLAADLKRHLNNEPVIARPPSVAYQLQKAWRRNRLVFTAAGAVAIALLLGIGVSTWLAFESSRAQKAAEKEKIAALHEAYVANMFSAGPAWEEYNYQKVRQLLTDTRASPDRGFEWYYWQRQTHLNLMTLYGHTNAVTSIAFFPDGQRIVTGSRDRSARVWDLATGKERLKLLGHTSWVNSVAVSRDGNQIATASSDQTVIVWDSISGRNLLTLPGHWGPLNALAFSPDGQRIVTGGSDGIGRIWDVATRQVIITLDGHTSSITSVAFSPDGEKVVTASTDQTAQVWRSADGNEIFPPVRDEREIMAVVFSPDGRKIVTGSLDQVGQFWDAETGAKLPLQQLVTKEPMVTLAFSRDGRRIVTGSWNSTARVWNTTNPEPELLILGHVRGLAAVAISPDGTRVVTGGFDRNVKVWDADGGREQLRVEGNATNSVLAVAISPDGKRIATGSGTFHNDGSTTGSGDQALQVWDSNTKTNLLTISGHGAGVSSVAFSPNGTQILSGSGDHTAKLWDAASGDLLSTLKGHTGSVKSVAFFPNGERIVTGSQDQTARVWNLATGHTLLILIGHTNTIGSVAVSSDGQRIVTGSHDETARVWDAATGRLLRTIVVPESKIYSVAFSPDSRRLAIAGYEPTTVWELVDPNRGPITLQGHSTPVSSVAFSPDGLRIVTGNLNGFAKVWEAATGRELLTLRGHTKFIYSVAMSADGQRIITGSADQTVRIWEAATPDQFAAWEADEGHPDAKVVK